MVIHIRKSKKKGSYNKFNNQRGSISIEASIVVPIVMVFLACSLLSYKFIGVIEKNEFESLKIERVNWHLRYADKEMPKELNYVVSGTQVISEYLLKDGLFKVQYRYWISPWYKTEELHTVSTFRQNILGPKKWTFIIPIYSDRGDGIRFNEEIVYITDTGKRYHLSTCFHLRKSKHAINIEKAKKKGYTPCKHCVHKKSKDD